MFTLRLLGGASIDGPDGPVAGRAGLRQRVALLALLAIDHPRPLSRDKLVAYLWPESGSDDARHLLRESLYILRSALGDDSVLSTGDDLRLNPDRLSCDLWEFEAAFARDDLEAAVRTYRGPFLSGFHLTDAEEFDPWAEGERSRLARRYGQALEQLAEREMRAGDALRAVEWWSRLAAEDRYNSRIALRYMQALDAAGDRAGALRHASVHSELLRTDLDAAPDREVVALAARLRVESRTGPGAVSAPTQSISAAPVPPDEERPASLGAALVAESDRPTRRRWVVPAVLVLGVVGGLGILGGALSRAPPPELYPRRVAVAVFANHTGRPDLDDLGTMIADWIIRGLMETPLIDVDDLEAVYAEQAEDSGGQTGPRSLARQSGAGLVVSGNYYRAGDSVLFQANIVDVASGRVLRSFVPVGAPIDRTGTALEALREAVTGGLSTLVNPANRDFVVDPDLTPPPNFTAYREFIAGLRQHLGDWEAASQHWRRSAELDSTFAAPLILLAETATIFDRCDLTDSIGTVLGERRERLTAWDRFTLDVSQARCRGKMEDAWALLERRLQAYPHSKMAQRQYAGSLVSANRPRAAQTILRDLDPRAPSADPIPWVEVYWCWLAVSHHMLGQYHEELKVTDYWPDSSAIEWPYIRGRALAAMGRDREVFELFQSLVARPLDEVTDPLLSMAKELAAHGHERTAMAVAESILARLEAGPGGDDKAREIAEANLLLGRDNAERAALERAPADEPDSPANLERSGRIAVLRGDTAEADGIDSILAKQSREPLRGPFARGDRLLARAHIAAGLGRRETAVARLRETVAHGYIYRGAFHAFHHDPLLAPLRGYPPFEALLRPSN